ncbi:MAG: hypothetical protein U1F67_15905 [Rubrivivax sp.]
MDEYVAGVATYYNTNDTVLKVTRRSWRCSRRTPADAGETARAAAARPTSSAKRTAQPRFEAATGFYYRTDKNFIG